MFYTIYHFCKVNTLIVHPGSIPCSRKARICSMVGEVSRYMERSCAINYLSNGGRFHCIKKRFYIGSTWYVLLGTYTLRSCLQALPHNKVIQVGFDSLWFCQKIPTSQKNEIQVNSKSHVDLILSNLQAAHVVLEHHISGKESCIST